MKGLILLCMVLTAFSLLGGQEADTGGQEAGTGGQENVTGLQDYLARGRRNPQMTSKFEWAGKKSSDMCKITPKTWHKLGSNADKIIIKVTVTFNKPVLKCTLR